MTNPHAHLQKDPPLAPKEDVPQTGEVSGRVPISPLTALDKKLLESAGCKSGPFDRRRFYEEAIDDAFNPKPTYYLAASFPRRGEARTLALTLKALGYHCTSRWLDQTHGTYGEEMQFPVMDAEDVFEGHFMIQLAGDTLTRGGRHTELGLYLGKCRAQKIRPAVFVLSKEDKREQVFHNHPGVYYVSSVLDLVEKLFLFFPTKPLVDYYSRMTRDVIQQYFQYTDVNLQKSLVSFATNETSGFSIE